jgi:hypothetical protein
MHYITATHPHLLKFQHVCFLDPEPLCDLTGTHSFLPPILFVQLQLFETVLSWKRRERPVHREGQKFMDQKVDYWHRNGTEQGGMKRKTRTKVIFPPQ